MATASGLGRRWLCVAGGPPDGTRPRPPPRTPQPPPSPVLSERSRRRRRCCRPRRSHASGHRGVHVGAERHGRHRAARPIQDGQMGAATAQRAADDAAVGQDGRGGHGGGGHGRGCGQ